MSEQVYEPIYKLPEFIGDGCFICRRLGIRRVLYRACGQHKLHRTCVLILRGQEAVPVIALAGIGREHIIDLRGRSSFQSPAYLSIEMIAAAMGGQPFRWPAGTYVSDKKFDHILMAMETSITKEGVSYKEIQGTPEEQKEMEESYAHLCKLRNEVIAMGILPEINKWHELNKHIN